MAKSILPKGVLTRTEIRSLEIISNSFDETCLQNASYDLRLGNEYYVPMNQKQQYCNEIKKDCPLYEAENKNEIKHCSDENDVLRMPKFSTVVFSTEEVLKMPENVVGRFDLRVRFAMQGLVLQVGTQIEPGYEGQLFGLLLNFSDKEICIPKGMRLLTAEFSYTCSKVALDEYSRKKYSSLKEFIDRFSPTKGTLETFFIRMAEIYGKNQEIQNEIKSEKSEIKQLIDRNVQELKELINQETTENRIEKSEIKQLIDRNVQELKELINQEMTENRIERSEKYKNNITLILSIAALIVAILIPVVVTYMSKKVIDKDDYPFTTIIETKKENEKLRNEKDTLFFRVSNLEEQINKIEQKLNVTTTQENKNP